MIKLDGGARFARKPFDADYVPGCNPVFLPAASENSVHLVDTLKQKLYWSVKRCVNEAFPQGARPCYCSEKKVGTASLESRPNLTGGVSRKRESMMIRAHEIPGIHRAPVGHNFRSINHDEFSAPLEWNPRFKA